MNTKTHLSFMLQYVFHIIVIVSLSVIFSILFTRYSIPVKGEITLFLSLGAEKSSDPGLIIEPGYTDLIDAADKFGETIRGWFKNPGFIDKLHAQVAPDLDFGSVKKQALQNVVIVVNSQSLDRQTLQKYGQAILQVIEGEIAQYNTATNSNYVIATSYVSVGIVYPSYKINGLTAAALSGFLSLAFFYLKEELSKKS